MNYSKQRIIENFSKYAVCYDRYARVQYYAAEKLFGYVSPLKLKPESLILEIGCGTGFISKKLIEQYPESIIILTDISAGMLEKCRDNLLASNINLDKVYFQVLDGESLESYERYDLIVSGLTVQWFDDLEGWLDRLNNSLKHDATVVFSYLSDKSFPEWKDSCNQLDIPFTGNKLPDDNLLGRLSRFKDVRCWWESEFKIEKYESLLHFFKEIKYIGAVTRHTSEEDFISPTLLRNLSRFHSNGSGCEISHHLIYGVIKAKQ